MLYFAFGSSTIWEIYWEYGLFFCALRFSKSTKLSASNWWWNKTRKMHTIFGCYEHPFLTYSIPPKKWRCDSRMLKMNINDIYDLFFKKKTWFPLVVLYFGIAIVWMVANSSPGVDRIGSTYPGRRRWRWPKPRCNCRRSVGTQVPLGGPHSGPWAGPGPKIQMCIFNYDNYIEKKWAYTYTWNSHIVIKVFTLKEWWLFFAFLGDCDIIFQLCFVHCSLHCLCNNIVYIYIYKCVCACVCV